MRNIDVGNIGVGAKRSGAILRHCRSSQSRRSVGPPRPLPNVRSGTRPFVRAGVPDILRRTWPRFDGRAARTFLDRPGRVPRRRGRRRRSRRSEVADSCGVAQSTPSGRVGLHKESRYDARENCNDGVVLPAEFSIPPPPARPRTDRPETLVTLNARRPGRPGAQTNFRTTNFQSHDRLSRSRIFSSFRLHKCC